MTMPPCKSQKLTRARNCNPPRAVGGFKVDWTSEDCGGNRRLAFEPQEVRVRLLLSFEHRLSALAPLAVYVAGL